MMFILHCNVGIYLGMVLSGCCSNPNNVTNFLEKLNLELKVVHCMLAQKTLPFLLLIISCQLYQHVNLTLKEEVENPHVDLLFGSAIDLHLLWTCFLTNL